MTHGLYAQESGAALVAQPRRETGFGQGSQRAQLFVVEDDRFWLTTQHWDDAVIACRSLPHDAGVTRNGDAHHLPTTNWCPIG